MVSGIVVGIVVAGSGCASVAVAGKGSMIMAGVMISWGLVRGWMMVSGIVVGIAVAVSGCASVAVAGKGSITGTGMTSRGAIMAGMTPASVSGAAAMGDAGPRPVSAATTLSRVVFADWMVTGIPEETWKCVTQALSRIILQESQKHSLQYLVSNAGLCSDFVPRV